MAVWVAGYIQNKANSVQTQLKFPKLVKFLRFVAGDFTSTSVIQAFPIMFSWQKGNKLLILNFKKIIKFSIISPYSCILLLWL